MILNEERQSKGLPVVEDMVTEAYTVQAPNTLVALRCLKELPKKHVLKGYGKSPSQSLYDNIEAYKINIRKYHFR